ncbi:MAG: DUF167 domain-containing protein [Deferribacterales bacterium]
MKLSVYIQPGAKKTEISGEHDGKLKIRVCAPPVEGAANEALVKFISKQLGLSRSKVNIVSGDKSRHKVLEIDMEESEVISKLS